MDTVTPNPWDELASAYELARQRPDSFDRILAWPAQREALGDLSGLRVLDEGCVIGAEALALAKLGVIEVIGVDVTLAFGAHDRDDVEVVQGDLSDLTSVPVLGGK